MANKDQLIGAGVLLGCLASLAVYFWLVFSSVWSIFLLKVTAFIAVAIILGMGAWIGWVLATTPPPESIEEIASTLTEEKTEETEQKASINC